MSKNNNIKSYLELHFIVLIWGFTAILGKLISLEAIRLVWYRLALSLPFLLVWVLAKHLPLRLSKQNFMKYSLGGLIIAMHWVAFFMAIKVSNISITLITMSTGAFFTSLLEPLFFKRHIKAFEVVLGLIMISGLYFIFQVNHLFLHGILWALLAAFLSALFSVINGLFVQENNGYTLSLYQLFFGWIGVSVFLAWHRDFNMNFFVLQATDWVYILVLSSICTAYAFAASLEVMKYIKPFTVMLTVNLEPVYGIVLALIIFGKTEKMQSGFYFGASIIFSVIVINMLVQKRKAKKEIT